MTVAHVATYGAGGAGNKAAGTNLDVTGVAYNAGDHLYAFVVCDDTLAADSILSTSVTGGTDITWSRIANNQAQTSASNLAMSIFRGVAASSQTGQTITFAPVATVAAKIMLIERFSGADASTRGSVSANGTSSTPSVTASGAQQPQSGDLLLGMLGVESTFDYTYTDDADTTNGTWVGDTTAGTSGGASTTNVRVHAQYKIVTANGDQTFNPGLSASKDWRAIIVSVVAAATTPASAPPPPWPARYKQLLGR